MKLNKIFIIAIVSIIIVAGCAAKTSTTTTIANATTSTAIQPTTTTTIPGPAVLADKVARFAVDATDIYYLTDSSPAKIFKLAKNSNTPVEFAADLGAQSRNLGQDGTYIYLTHTGSLGVKLSRIPKAGGAVEDIYSCAPGTSGSIFADDKYIYVFPYSGTFCRILKTNLISDGNFRGVVSDAGQNIILGNNSAFYSDSLWIKKVPTAGKFEVGILIADVAQSNLLIDGITVYWVSKNNELYKIGVDGKGKSLMLAGVAAKYIAQDSSNIYFIDSGNATKKISKGGGAGIPVQTLTGAASDLYADDSGIYWIEGGSLKKLNK